MFQYDLALVVTIKVWALKRLNISTSCGNIRGSEPMALNLDPSQEARQRLSKFVHVHTLQNVSRSDHLNYDNCHNHPSQVFYFD